MSGGGGPTGGDETALQQPRDAVLMKSWDRSEAFRLDQEAGSSTPARNDGAASYKGKERAMDDNLSIEMTDAPNSPDNPVCTITLLLPTGARHPYRIDEKYLSKRGVDIPDVTEAGKKDPFSISVYKLKELILREWRDDWEAKPASPSSIRLIHFGKLLDDKEQLKSEQAHMHCVGRSDQTHRVPVLGRKSERRPHVGPARRDARRGRSWQGQE